MFQHPEEYFYLHVLCQWQRTAPPDGHQGTKGNGQVARNTQAARMAYLLSIIDNGDCKTFKKLAIYTRRNDGTSYVSDDHGWMREPHHLRKGWYFEGCMSLKDKQGVLQYLPRLGLSASFVPCAQDFVAGKPLDKYWPSEEDATRQLALWNAQSLPCVDGANAAVAAS